MIGLRTTLKTSPRVGLAVGSVADELGGVVVPFDGTTLIRRPTAENHWAAIQWPVPSWMRLLQEASGAVVDTVHGLSAAVAGTGHTYQVQGSESTYASKGIQLVDGTTGMGFTSASTASFDSTYHPVCIYLEIEVLAVPAATRAIYALTGAASAHLSLVTSTGAKLRLQGGTAVNGTYNYADGKRHPVLVEWFPGTITGGRILDHTTSRMRVSTDKEQFSATWAFVGAGTKGIGTGGSASLSSANVAYFVEMIFAGSSALEIGNTITPKVFIQRKGWTVTGY